MTLLFKSGDDWTHQLLEDIWTEVEKIGREDLKTTFYPPLFEIVTSKQMIDAYTSVGMPIYYNHWSFGKEFIQYHDAYRSDMMNLAYEMVINSNPCLAYLMEENNALLQTLVIAHASVGHSAVFKNNDYFLRKTDATAILDYLAFAKMYVARCEEKYGLDEVEQVLDACHTIYNYGVDKYKKPKKLSPLAEEKRALARFEQELGEYDPLWEKVKGKRKERSFAKKEEELSEPEENILRFIEKQAPKLATWKREIIRIVRKCAHYFSPQGPTQVVNEGYATFTHYYILHRLYEKGLIDSGSMLEMYKLHSGVINQQNYTRLLAGRALNPYKLGFSIFMDIKRMCEEPTDEDRKYFPLLAGGDWREHTQNAMKYFKNDSFILQYLSPAVIRDLSLFSYVDVSESSYYEVKNISNERGYEKIKELLSLQSSTELMTPDIQVVGVDHKRTRMLKLKHFAKQGRPLGIMNAKKVLAHVASLWEYAVDLETIEIGDGDPRELHLVVNGRYSVNPEEPEEEA